MCLYVCVYNVNMNSILYRSQTCKCFMTTLGGFGFRRGATWAHATAYVFGASLRQTYTVFFWHSFEVRTCQMQCMYKYTQQRQRSVFCLQSPQWTSACVCAVFKCNCAARTHQQAAIDRRKDKLAWALSKAPVQTHMRSLLRAHYKGKQWLEWE